MRVLPVVAIVLLVASAPARVGADVRPTPREGAEYAVPLYGTLVRAWDAPEDDPFAPGHRGIDIGAPSGSPVRASAGGIVSFAGNVAGNRTVSIDHPDGVRTSSSYLGTIAVKKGDHVLLGDVVGTVGTGHPPGSAQEPMPSHVHISARRDGVYFDPVGLYVGTSYSDLLALVA